MAEITNMKNLFRCVSTFVPSQTMYSVLHENELKCSRANLDRSGLCKLHKVTCFSFSSLIIYVVHSEIFSLALCSKIASKNDSFRLAMTVLIFICLTFQREGKYIDWSVQNSRNIPIIINWASVLSCNLSRIHRTLVITYLICKYLQYSWELH